MDTGGGTSSSSAPSSDAAGTADDGGIAPVIAAPHVGDDDDTIVDDTPEFIDMQDAVEVMVDDDLPMEDDDDDDDDDVAGEGGAEKMGRDGITPVSTMVSDMSQFQLRSHTDAVYSVASFVENGTLSVLSGGGDDRAYQSKIEQQASTWWNGTGSAAPETSASASSSTSMVPTTTVQPLSYPFTDTVSCVAYNLAHVSSDLKKTPRFAAVGSFDGSILVYDPDTAAQILKLEGPTDVEWLSFHPKGGSVLLAGSSTDGTVWMFHVHLNRCLQVFVGHEGAVTAGGFSPDGRWALSAGADGTLRIWAPKTGMARHVFRLGNGEGGGGLTCMATDGGSDGMLVVVGSEDGQAHVCHIGTKRVVASMRHFEVPSASSSADDGDEDVEYPMSVEAVGFYPAQSSWCATGGVDGKLKIWDLARDGQCRQVCVPPHQEVGEEAHPDHNGATSAFDSITRLQWHPVVPVVITAYVSGSVRLWDARNGKLVHTLTGSLEQINDMDVQFLPADGAAVIVTGSDDRTVRVFHLDVNAVVQTGVAEPTSTQQ